MSFKEEYKTKEDPLLEYWKRETEKGGGKQMKTDLAETIFKAIDEEGIIKEDVPEIQTEHIWSIIEEVEQEIRQEEQEITTRKIIEKTYMFLPRQSKEEMIRRTLEEIRKEKRQGINIKETTKKLNETLERFNQNIERTNKKLDRTIQKWEETIEKLNKKK